MNSAATTERPSWSSTLYVLQAAGVSMISTPMPRSAMSAHQVRRGPAQGLTGAQDDDIRIRRQGRLKVVWLQVFRV